MMSHSKFAILLLVVMIAVAITIYVGMAFDMSPGLIALISFAVALTARLMLRRS